MKKLFISLLFLLLCIAYADDINSCQLKPRQPNWYVDIVSLYPNGAANVIICYEPTDEGRSAVKRVTLYDSGSIMQETDLMEITEDMPGYKMWNSKIVPHGMCVDFSSDNKITKVSRYDQGLLEGEVITYYSQNKIMTKMTYKDGVLQGIMEGFYENGSKKMVCMY